MSRQVMIIIYHSPFIPPCRSVVRHNNDDGGDSNSNEAGHGFDYANDNDGGANKHKTNNANEAGNDDVRESL